jgi:hypothetical protein
VTVNVDCCGLVPSLPFFDSSDLFLPTPTFHDKTSGDRLGEPLGEASGPPFEREAVTTQPLTEPCKIHSPVTHKV